MRLYSIGQASAMIGVPIRTIRYYESIGLCTPSLTDGDSGYRYYSIDDIFRLDLIRCLGRQLGMPLGTIRRYLEESGSPEKLKACLLEQERDIDAQMAELALRKDFLARKLEAVSRREQTVFLVPAVAALPERTLSVRRQTADSLEDAMLQARRMAAQQGDGNSSELYLLFDSLEERFSSPGEHAVTVGISGSHPGGGLTPLLLEAGDYLSICYPNRDEARVRAVALLREALRERGAAPLGPMVNCGSLIDTASVSSRDYCITTQLRVG